MRQPLCAPFATDLCALAALVCCRGSLEEEAHLRMHEVEQAVHDAEAEEAASGRDDSTGGQEWRPLSRHSSPWAALLCCGQPANDGHSWLARDGGTHTGLLPPCCPPAVPAVIRPGSYGSAGAAGGTPRSAHAGQPAVLRVEGCL